MKDKERIEQALFSDTSRYDAIMAAPRHVSRAHLPMPREDRAAQFAPFAALTGYHKLLAETASHYQRKHYLNQAEKKAIEKQVAEMQDHLPLEVKLEYFDGQSGYYQEYSGELRHIDRDRHKLVFTDGLAVAVANLRKIRVQES
jgi:hypothetical protein